MPYANIHDQQLWFEEAGAGEALILLHHGTGSTRSWRHQMPALAAKHQVLAYDRPGFGRSDWLEAWSLDYLDRDVGDLIALLDQLGIDAAGLVGNSDGAAIALMAAARHPGRVQWVVAEAPHVSVELPRCPDAIRQFIADLPEAPQVQKGLAREHGDRAPQVVQRWADRWLDPAFWSWNVAPELASVRCPVLVVHGLHDPYFSLDHSQLIADAVPGSRLSVHPDLGHVPHLEAPQRFNELVLAFLP